MSYSAPKLATVLNYSAGTQSEWLLWMVLLGKIERPANFAVLNADPGMENTESYRFTEAMRERCADAGIRFVTAAGPSLYRDILTLKERGANRFDQAPFWTTSDSRSEGKLAQRCTAHYKVAPMDRELHTGCYGSGTEFRRAIRLGCGLRPLRSGSDSRPTNRTGPTDC